MDDMAALKEEKESIVDKEMPKLLAEIGVLQNELAVNDQRLQNIKKEKYQFEKAQAEFDKIIGHIESFQNTVQWKKKRENEEMESLQVRKYQQTIIQATLVDEMDQLIIFLEELIKRLKGDKTAEDLYAFQQLSDQDQERVNELLVKVGLGYSSKTQSGYGKAGK